MQFEQLSIDQQSFDLPQTVIYRQLDNEGKVYCKIDWLTVMFFDCSLNHVLRWLHMQECVSDFCTSAFEQSRGYDQVFKFLYNSIMLETSSFNYYGSDVNVSIFDVIVPKIRLELSGSALDYLRSIGVDMDIYRFSVPDLPDGGSYHFTRCDFAFDFINYREDFVDKLIDHIDRHQLPSGRVPLASTKGAIGVRVVTGNQKTVYLGSPQSDRMLRVYDKRLQSIDRASGVYVKNNPYGDPAAWFRIEWQCRNKLANNLVLDSNLEFKHILKLIFEKYAFADGEMDARNKARVVVDFWNDLFDWKDLETRIIQNAKYVQYDDPDIKLIKSFESIMLRTFIFYASLVGKEGLENACNKYLRSLEKDDPVSIRRYQIFLSKLNNLTLSDHLPTSSGFGLWNNSGRLHFKL